MNRTKIPWADYVWNPVIGCTHAGSPGCDNCYARRLHDQRHKAYLEGKQIPECYSEPFSEIRIFPDRLGQSLRTKKPGRVFVCSMGDLFHDDVSDEFIDDILQIMMVADRHIYMILTKRENRMVRFFDTYNRLGFFPPNIWLGVTVEHADYLDRIEFLRRTPAKVKFLSLEPLLSSLPKLNLEGIDWVICGGESGPNARPMHPDWARSLRDQCKAAGVPFFFKQWGGVGDCL